MTPKLGFTIKIDPKIISVNQRRLEKAMNTDHDKLTTITQFLHITVEQLNQHNLDTSVPGEKPFEMRNGDVLRLTSTNNVASPASMCTEDDTSCAAYPPNGLRCAGDRDAGPAGVAAPSDAR